MSIISQNRKVRYDKDGNPVGVSDVVIAEKGTNLKSSPKRKTSNVFIFPSARDIREYEDSFMIKAIEYVVPGEGDGLGASISGNDITGGEFGDLKARTIIADDVICGYLLTDPHIVDTRKTMLLTEESQDSGNVEISLVPWIMLTSERKVPIAKDWIVTIVEPIDTVKKIYEEKVNGQDNQTDSSDEQTNLSE